MVGGGYFIVYFDYIFRLKLHRRNICHSREVSIMEQMLHLPYNITCGYCDCSEFGNLHSTSSRDVVRFEIEYYLVDALTTTMDDIVYPIKADHILIAKPEQKRFSQLPFYTMFLKFDADGILAERLLETPMYFAAVNVSRIKSLLNDLILLKNDQQNQLLFYSSILNVLQLILSDSLVTGRSSSVSEEMMETAKEYMNKNYARPLSLQDIAASVSLSPSHFHAMFKSICGMSPHDYLTSRRIDAAKDMLWNTHQGIPEIAASCGFGGQQYFSKVFKEQTGSTPSRYRRNKKSDDAFTAQNLQ